MEYSVDDTDSKAKKPPPPPPSKSRSPRRQPGKTVLKTHHTSSSDKCPFCMSDHNIFHCTTFRQKSIAQRRDWVRTSGLCFNCLGANHRLVDCRSKYKCKECQARHHTLLHEKSSSTTSDGSLPEATVNIATNPQSGDTSFSLPSRAIVTVQATGLVQKARAQMDSGATISLITRTLSNTLKAPRIPT